MKFNLLFFYILDKHENLFFPYMKKYEKLLLANEEEKILS